VSLTLCSTPWSLYKVHIEQEQDKKEKESRDKEAAKSVVDDGENGCLDDGSRWFCGTVLSCARNEPFVKQESLDYFSDLASLLSYLLQFCNWFLWQCLSTLHLSYQYLMFIWEAYVFQRKDVNPSPGIEPTANDTGVGQYLKNTQVPELQVKRNCLLDEAVSCKWRKVAAGTVVQFKEFSYWYSVTLTVR